DDARSRESGDLQALEAHASLADDGNRVGNSQVRGFDRCDAVTQRLQASSFAVGNAIVDLHQGDFRQNGNFRKATRHVEADHGALTAQVGSLRATEWAIAAGQLGSRRDSIANVESAHAAASFNDFGAEFMAEQLNRSFGFKSAFHAVV